jgi:hypothetical protein
MLVPNLIVINYPKPTTGANALTDTNLFLKKDNSSYVVTFFREAVLGPRKAIMIIRVCNMFPLKGFCIRKTEG